MNKTIKSLIAAFVAMSTAVVSFAQITTSGLSGVVVDEAGAPAVGVAVVATHEPSGTVYGVVTNAEGRYTVNGMRTGGPYKVEVSSLGYQTVTYTDLTLQLGEPYTLNVTMKDDSETLADAIVISEATSKFAGERTGAVTNISNAEMLAAPTVSRSISDITRLSPYGGNGMSFAGADGRTANFTVDGANFNNNFGLSSSLPGGGNPISIDAIEEIQVVISPFDVRQTDFIGGGVNAITKSGTNTFKGTAYVYHRNENLRGDTIYGEPITSARDKDRNTNFGFTLGGPIIKNKLFFFVNAEYAKVPTIANRYRASKNGVEDATNYISRVTEADLKTVSDFAKEKYGYDTGSFTEFPANESNLKLLARVDWNISDKHRLAFRYNYTLNKAWNSPNGTSMDGGSRMPSYRTSLKAMSYANSMYSIDNVVSTFSLDLNSRLTDNISNQFLATFSKLDDVRGTNSDEFPFIDILDGSVTGGDPADNYIALGYELFTWKNAVHNTVWNIKDDVTMYLGKHTVTAGARIEYQMADNAYMRNGSGYYRYNSIEDFMNGATPDVVCLTYGYDGETAPAARVQFYRPSVYVQDKWAVNDKLDLTYGLRIDGLFFNNNDLKTNNAILEIDYIADNGDIRNIDTGKWPSANLSVTPRIGFNYDVLGNNRLKVRGGTGFFTGRLPLVFFTNMPTNAGTVQYQAQINAKSKFQSDCTINGTDYKKGDLIPMDLFKGGLVTKDGKATTQALYEKLIAMGFPSTYDPAKGTVPSAISAVDPNFKMPQVWKTSLGVDYALPTAFPLSVSAEFTYNKTLNGVMISDWSIKPAEEFVKFNGADNRPVFPKSFRTGTKAFVLENTNKGYGYLATVGVKAAPVEGLKLSLAYTRTASKEITGMPGSAAESAFTYVPTVAGPNRIQLHNSQYVTPDRVVASVNYQDKGNNTFSIIYEATHGGYNYSYMMVNDMNGDGYNYDTVYIPTDAQVENNEFRFVSDDDAKRFMDFVHKDSYLSKHQGQYAEGYSVYNPWLHRIDFKYTHDFKVKACGVNNVLQLSVDVKNLANLFNSEWGVVKTLNPAIGSDARILKYEGVDAEGYATFSTPKAINGSTETFQPLHVIGQCWYAGVGIKYFFN